MMATIPASCVEGLRPGVELGCRVARSRHMGKEERGLEDLNVVGTKGNLGMTDVVVIISLAAQGHLGVRIPVRLVVGVERDVELQKCAGRVYCQLLLSLYRVQGRNPIQVR